MMLVPITVADYPDCSNFHKKEQPCRWSWQLESGVMNIQEASECFKLTKKRTFRLAAGGKILDFNVCASRRFRKMNATAGSTRKSLVKPDL